VSGTGKKGANLRTSSLGKRRSKVDAASQGRTVPAGSSFRRWLDSLPDVLAARDLQALAGAVASAHRRKRRVILGMGAHVIKCGLSPLIVDLMADGVVTAVALNGAGAIHDFELAWSGKTSEDVGPALDKGTFGTARETGEFINGAAVEGARTESGLGETLGRMLLAKKPPNGRTSLLCAGARHNVPVTVHVALGTDITHMHPGASGAAIGETSLRDFHRLTDIVARLEGGVYLNVGSAVVMPEVFLKALALARNRRKGLPRRFVTANLDFLPHYRPMQNVVLRPTAAGGQGYQIIGHHELLLPLLFAAVREELASS
jgi:deoxyhypusine synthase